jgi:4-amino-4-deoxy-L-arabinose transferase-like glycosyltransferase
LKSPIPRWFASTSALVVLGAAVRIAFLLTKGDAPSFSDTYEYEAVAMQMLGKTHGAALPRAPLYPAVMALGFLLGGVKNYWAVRWVQLPFGIALIPVVQKLAERIGGRTAGWLAGLGTAFAPTLIFVSSMLYPTSLYTFILAAMTLAAIRLAESPRNRYAVVLGVLAVLGWMTDTVIAAPMIVLCLWMLTRVRTTGPALVRAMLIVGVTMIAVMTPYQMVRRHAGGSPQAFVQKSQWVLHFARTDSTLGAHRWVELPAGESGSTLPMGEFMRHEMHLLGTQPVAYVHDVGFEFLHFFAPMPDRVQTRNQYNQPAVLIVGAIYFTPVLALFLFGLWRGRGRRDQRLVLALVVFATAGFYSLFFTQTRYRIPVEPQMIALASLGVGALIEKRRPSA